MKKLKMIVVSVLFGLGMIAPSSAQVVSTERLVTNWIRENGLCINGPQGEPSTQDSCNRSALIGLELNKRGWCYGKEYQATFQYEWHWCAEGSWGYKK